MKYQDKSFSSRPASKEYLENWERAFGKKTQAHALQGARLRRTLGRLHPLASRLLRSVKFHYAPCHL